jgi:UDPglucose 6-dehydrogenase
MNVCVIGLWHQGIVGAACLADLGCSVVAADHDTKKIGLLSGGKAPLCEPGLEELIQKGLRSGKLTFSSDVAGSVKSCPYVLIMFDTPVNDRDESDLSEVFATVAEIAPRVENGVVLYVTAQVPVGTCAQLAQSISELNPSLSFGIAYSPENLRLGQAIDRFLHPALPVIGTDDPATVSRLEPLLALLNVEWQRVGLRTAEMTKHALNAFLATSICFANELGNLCDEVGADGRRIAEVLRLEPRVGSKAMLFPGLGFAGGTLARDMHTLRSLGDELDIDTLMLDGAWE